MHARRPRFATTSFELESRDVPAPLTVGATSLVAVAPDGGGRPVVQLVDAATNRDVASVQAYEDSFRGGVHAALGDVTGDGVKDLVIAPGQGGGPRIRILDGASGNTLADFFVYESSYTGGVYVALGDVNGDGRADLVTGTGNGGGPRVRVLDGATLGRTVLTDFFAYESSFRGGVQVAAGDLDGDGRAEIVTGTGVGGGPRVRAFDAAGAVVRDFFAYEAGFRGGVNVGTGDLDGDGRAEVLTGTGVGGGPVVRAFGTDGRALASFLADEAGFRGGVRVDAVRLAGGVSDTVVARVRRGDDDVVRLFRGDTGAVLGGVVRRVDDLNPSTPAAAVVFAGTAARYLGTVNATGDGSIGLRLLGGEMLSAPITASATPVRVGDTVDAQVGADGTATVVLAPDSGSAGPVTVTGNPSPRGEVLAPDDDSMIAEQTPTESISVAGTVWAVDAAANSLTLLDFDGREQVVRLTTDTTVLLDGKVVTLADVRVGFLAQVVTDMSAAVIRVEAFTPPPRPNPGYGGFYTSSGNTPGPNADVQGVVSSVDPAARSFTLRNDLGLTLLIKTTSETTFERDSKPTTFDAIQVGGRAEAITDDAARVTRVIVTATVPG